METLREAVQLNAIMAQVGNVDTQKKINMLKMLLKERDEMDARQEKKQKNRNKKIYYLMLEIPKYTSLKKYEDDLNTKPKCIQKHKSEKRDVTGKGD